MESKEIKGRIFDIQRFSIHDGPGIRTVIFLKGCPLRCRWCCNPEAQEYEIQEMIVNGSSRIVGKDVTIEEILEEAEKDRAYYRRSGGGITLSGGEALAQPEFGRMLLMNLKEAGFHTAIETTGFAKFSIIESYLPYLDLFLMDIKHMNSKKHMEFTTKPNELIVENAYKIAKHHKELIIRVPVIPTFNDTKEEILEIAEFTKKLCSAKEIHLLPYHRLGENKYTGLNRKYMLENIKPIAEGYMNQLAEVVKSTGLKCQIGG